MHNDEQVRAASGSLRSSAGNTISTHALALVSEFERRSLPNSAMRSSIPLDSEALIVSGSRAAVTAYIDMIVSDHSLTAPDHWDQADQPDHSAQHEQFQIWK